MPEPLTITVAEAAQRLGFPKATTERIARDLGLLILAGNRKRIHPDDLPEIMDTCRSAPRVPVSIATQRPASTLSETPAGATVQQAREAVARLKGRSPSTSATGTGGRVVPLTRTG